MYHIAHRCNGGRVRPVYKTDVVYGDRCAHGHGYHALSSYVRPRYYTTAGPLFYRRKRVKGQIEESPYFAGVKCQIHGGEVYAA